MLLSILLYLSLLENGLGFILPMNTNSGEVDLQSVVTHITLLEQKVGTLEPEVIMLKSKVADLEAKVAASHKQQAITTNGLKTLQTQISTVRNKTIELIFQTNQTKNNNETGGATFTRWGRTSCPSGNDEVYKGFAAGAHYQNKGGAGNMLCLSDQPIYANHTPGLQWMSTIYGTEYETGGAPAFKSLVDDDMPCVVCRSQSKHSSVMVPGRNQCFPGWDREYWGYLMGPWHDYASTQYICVDTDAEAEPGSKDKKNGNVLYQVKGICGSLTCPPYKDHWQLTCAVCGQ